MADFLTVIGIALLPAAGNLLGAVIAELLKVGPRLVGALLHGAAGIAIAVVSVELMPRIVGRAAPWLMALAFCAGALFSVALARGVRRTVVNMARSRRRAWMVYFAVAADLFSDGLMTGVGSSIATRVGLLLGLAQVVANVPGGFATTANFRHKEVSRTLRVIAAASFLVPSLLAATLGYGLLRDAAGWVRAASLAFVVGVLLLATIEDVVPQADEPRTDRWVTTSSFALGFVGFALVSLYLDV